ncbi:hypothetical protein [Kribbella solani]|uniref:Uncharacterized protein n=1 Tax=Kribbella solani TaxID=236067 RepID=A0A841DYP3_9ACTN|nr:hypothetical protein [Kribbella solani]MBB5983091.1 hypothetical protein [Kribbella solani]
MSAITAPAKVRRPRVSLQLLRITLVIHAILIIMQPIMAGYFLAGNVDAMDTHSAIGTSLWLIAFIQTVIAGCYALAGGGRFWPLIVSAVLTIAEFVQLTYGYLQDFAVHIPLGTALVTTVVWMTVWSFRSAARLSRREAKR